MTTSDLKRLEQVERLLGNALHDADSLPVDLRAGRARLAPRLVEQRRSVRRRTIICLAASVLAVVVVAAVALGGLRGERNSLPVAPSPELTFSSSGLPVGLLLGKVDRTETRATSTVRMIVRPDGTGIWNAGTVGDTAGDSVLDYDVEFVSDGPGSAIMMQRRDQGFCITDEALSLDFAVRGRTLVITRASSSDCIVNSGLASDLTGTTMRILPPPGT